MSSVTCRAPGVCSATVTLTSANTALMSSTLAALWLKKQQQQERRRRSASTAYPGCNVVAQHERKRHHPRSNGRITRPRRFATYALAKTSIYRLPVVANSANRATLRDGTSYPSEVSAAVRVNQYCGRESLEMSSSSHPSHLPSSCQCASPTTQSFKVSCPALFYSQLCPHPYALHGSTAGQAYRRLNITEALPRARSRIRYDIQGRDPE